MAQELVLSAVCVRVRAFGFSLMLQLQSCAGMFMLQQNGPAG